MAVSLVRKPLMEVQAMISLVVDVTTLLILILLEEREKTISHPADLTNQADLPSTFGVTTNMMRKTTMMTSGATTM